MDFKQFRNYVWGMYGNNTISRGWELYKKSQHALWKARAERASLEKVAASGWEDYRAEHPKSTIGMTRWYSSWWKAEPKCLKKAKEFE